MNGFDKSIPSQISEYELYNVASAEHLEKVASANVDLPDGFEFDPDFMYLWVRIISAGEYYGPNKNGDYFPESELIDTYETFKDGHVFKNHENKKIEQAIGEIISVRWNPVLKCVEIFKSIDKKIAPEIVRGFEKGYLTDVSMGCRVPYTICSVCGNKARKQTEFCDHIRHYRMQFLGNGERVYEINHKPKFHDSSAVLNGAERVAKALVVFDSGQGQSKTAFQKVASANGKTRFIRLSDYEMDKVASHDKVLHPLVQKDIEKVASHTNPMFQKLAELEKELTGKIVNVSSIPTEESMEKGGEMLRIIKFLTEKRFDDDSLMNIAGTLKSLAEEEGLSEHKVFSTFLVIAETLGIEFFPGELHTILSGLTDAHYRPELSLSDSDKKDVFPSDVAKAFKVTSLATEQLPDINDPSGLTELYDDTAHDMKGFNSDPFGFIGGINVHDDLDDIPSAKVVKVIRSQMSPFLESRSQGADYLIPRLSAVLTGGHSLVGGSDVRRDIDMMVSPKSLGDILGTLAYRSYQDMRPKIRVTRLIKMAQYLDSELEKTAAFSNPFDGLQESLLYNNGVAEGKRLQQEEAARIAQNKRAGGLGTMKLLGITAPLVYGASAFEKNRRENGRNLSDAENFIADRPGLLTLGGVVAGKPVSKVIMRDFPEAVNKAKSAITKSAEQEFEELVKEASVYPSGNFSAFNEEFLTKFASENGLNANEVALLKTATLLSSGNMEKEAKELLDRAGLPSNAKGLFLKSAAEYTHGQIKEASNDFLNTLVLDTIADNRSFAGSIPGRMVDAFVFGKLLNSSGSKPKSQLNPENVKHTLEQNGVNIDAKL